MKHQLERLNISGCKDTSIAKCTVAPAVMVKEHKSLAAKYERLIERVGGTRKHWPMGHDE